MVESPESPETPNRLWSTGSEKFRGYFAHEEIPPSHWCVVKEDLVKLRWQVKDGVDRKQIVPTDLDPFDPNDNEYGPSVYTVANQLLKGVSYIDGGSSWALRQHPEGLECDLFISHTWAEGIFEFIDKVVHAWPHGTRHAYCCMLSNPQTLDIGCLIASPIDSPFARALRVAKHVLVVPNRQCSIYNRSWCTYEVFLAYKWNKTITVATPPALGVWKNASSMFLINVLSLGIAFASFKYAELSDSTTKTIIAYICTTERVVRLLVILMPDKYEATHNVANICGLVLFGILTAGKLCRYICLGWRMERSVVEKVADVACWELVAMIYIFNRIDLLWYRQLAVGRAQLATGYSGRIRDSKATYEEDKYQILNEIRQSDGEEMADKTIAVLLKSGICSKSLRMAHELGVDIAGVGVVKSKLVWAAVSFSCILSLHPTSLRECYGASSFAMAASLVVTSSCVVIWAARMYCKLDYKDQRAFMAAVAWKMLGLPVLLFETASRMASLSAYFMAFPGAGMLTVELLRVQLVVVLPICCCLALLVSFQDLARLASIPVVGVQLATFLATSDLRCSRVIHAHARVTSISLLTVPQDIELSRVEPSQ